MLTKYIQKAMEGAEYTILEDGTYCGTIPTCPGVIAFDSTLEACRCELQDVLEGWILLGLQDGDPLPVLGGINLNRGREWPGKSSHRAPAKSLSES
jgi:predicted RNase H-like HicB family nuclease